MQAISIDAKIKGRMWLYFSITDIYFVDALNYHNLIILYLYPILFGELCQPAEFAAKRLLAANDRGLTGADSDCAQRSGIKGSFDSKPRSLSFVL